MTKLSELQRQIEEIKRKQAACNHNFGEPFYNPDTKMEGYGSKLVTQGSDAWHEYVGFKEVKVDRWTRVCTKCEYEQHTDKQEPVIKEYRPKF